MKIKFLEKVTLLDYPGKVACIIFLYGCNFRCPFCYNPELVIREESLDYSEEKVLDFLKKRIGKLDAVCFTGGEALLTLDKDFVKKVRNMGFLIKLDTNGTLPNKLKEFIDEGLLDYVAMDIKFTKKDYPSNVGVKVDTKKIEESMKILEKGNIEYEFRTTILPNNHTEEKMKEIGKWVNEVLNAKPKNYYLQGFKNYGKFIDMKYKELKNTKELELKKIKRVVQKYFLNVGVRI